MIPATPTPSLTSSSATACRVGGHTLELHNGMIFLHLATGAAELGSNTWAWAQRCSRPGGCDDVAAATQRPDRARRTTIASGRVATRRSQQQQGMGDGTDEKRAAGTAAVAATTTVDATAKATARRVRWLPALTTVRAVAVPVAEHHPAGQAAGLAGHQGRRAGGHGGCPVRGGDGDAGRTMLCAALASPRRAPSIHNRNRERSVAACVAELAVACTQRLFSV